MIKKINYNDYDEYYLIKDNNGFKFIIGVNQDELIIKHKYYSINMNKNNLLFLTKKMFITIDEAYEYISNIFEQNKVIIKEIKFRTSIILLLKVFIDGIEKIIEIILIYKKENILNNKIFKDNIYISQKEIKDIKNNII